MTPLGCPDCLLIRYEPRALRPPRAPSCFPGQAYVLLDFWPFFFQACFFKVRTKSTPGSFRTNRENSHFATIHVSRRQTGGAGYEILDVITRDFAWILPPPPIIPYAAEQSPGSRLTRPFVASFKLASNRWISRAIIRCNLAAWRL